MPSAKTTKAIVNTTFPTEKRSFRIKDKIQITKTKSKILRRILMVSPFYSVIQSYSKNHPMKLK
jgi:hypothetical protein